MKKFLYVPLTGFLLFNLIACSNNDNKTNNVEEKKVASQDEKSKNNLIDIEKYSKIKPDMTYEEVKNIIGSEGDKVVTDGTEGSANYKVTYAWKGTKPKSMAQITFLNGKLRSKTQNGLE
ncbi:DUF3862 domain-containing protein [Bacillus sp. S10(2024)]|uniref:DUF3862 domain-containing protein n=1 Tax=Bacillus sp. S10(2024) TaxID=3162886 RepID=UPI003D1DE836